mmetsp:Transcript_41580/g.131048  ORF Transcript_41580/g.131048 Transcript_41580/m.131048 type:complete len:225 (+) Transcript_41580:1952-2626(+)
MKSLSFSVSLASCMASSSVLSCCSADSRTSSACFAFPTWPTARWKPSCSLSLSPIPSMAQPPAAASDTPPRTTDCCKNFIRRRFSIGVMIFDWKISALLIGILHKHGAGLEPSKKLVHLRGTNSRYRPTPDWTSEEIMRPLLKFSRGERSMLKCFLASPCFGSSRASTLTFAYMIGLLFDGIAVRRSGRPREQPSSITGRPILSHSVASHAATLIDRAILSSSK